MADPSRVRVTGPLESFAVGFAGELGVQGYKGQGIRHQLRLMAHLSQALADYLVLRRALGYKLKDQEQLLNRFLASRGSRPGAAPLRRAAAVQVAGAQNGQLQPG